MQAFRVGEVLLKLQFTYECFIIWINLQKVCWCYTENTVLCALEVYLKVRYGWWAASMGLSQV